MSRRDSKPQGGQHRPHGQRPDKHGSKHQDFRPQGPQQKPPAATRKPQDRPERSKPAPERAASRVEIWIYGYHPAAAALANPARKILRVIATPESAERLRGDAGVPAESLQHMRVMGRREIDQLVGEEAVHQGVAVLARPLDHHLQDILGALEDRDDVCLVLLDQVTDPHNVGAVLRSAAAFGASAVIAPDRHAPEETGVMAKSASGALDKVPYVKTVNLVRAIEILKEARFWLVGLEADAGPALAEVDLTGRIALVLGAEGEGIRRLVAEACDHRARLPIASAVESLNVSNAAAVALYEKARQITGKRK